MSLTPWTPAAVTLMKGEATKRRMSRDGHHAVRADLQGHEKE
jgi:hypothetical protein